MHIEVEVLPHDAEQLCNKQDSFIFIQSKLIELFFILLYTDTEKNKPFSSPNPTEKYLLSRPPGILAKSPFPCAHPTELFWDLERNHNIFVLLRIFLLIIFQKTL